MLTELCAEVKNYFVKEIYDGYYHIVDGIIEPLEFLQDGQYFRIVGSVFNDGVHKYPYAELEDEEFYGSIWALAIPKDFVLLSESIEKWNKENEKNILSVYTSESFGGYSYTKGTNSSGGVASWQENFASSLRKYRRLILP